MSPPPRRFRQTSIQKSVQRSASITVQARAKTKATITAGEGDKVNILRNGELEADVQSYPRIVPLARVGNAMIVSGQTKITVTHGSVVTPLDTDIFVQLCNIPTVETGNIKVDNITATTFDITVRTNPGASGAIFAWRVHDAPGVDDEVVVETTGNTGTTVTGKVRR